MTLWCIDGRDSLRNVSRLNSPLTVPDRPVAFFCLSLLLVRLIGFILVAFPASPTHTVTALAPAFVRVEISWLWINKRGTSCSVSCYPSAVHLSTDYILI